MKKSWIQKWICSLLQCDIHQHNKLFECFELRDKSSFIVLWQYKRFASIWAGVVVLLCRVTVYKPFDSVSGKSENAPKKPWLVLREICWIIWLSCLWNCEWIQMVFYSVLFGFWWTWPRRPPENECSTLWSFVTAWINTLSEKCCTLLNCFICINSLWLLYFGLCKQDSSHWKSHRVHSWKLLEFTPKFEAFNQA